MPANSDQNPVISVLSLQDYVPLDKASELLNIASSELFKRSKRLPIYAREFCWQMSESLSNWDTVYTSILAGIDMKASNAYINERSETKCQLDQIDISQEKPINELCREKFGFRSKVDYEKFFMANSWIDKLGSYLQLNDTQLEKFQEYYIVPGIILEKKPPERENVGSITLAFKSHIYVDGVALENLLSKASAKLSSSNSNQFQQSEDEQEKKLLDPLDEVLLKIVEDSITSARDVWNKLRHEANNPKPRKYDRNRILVEIQNSCVSENKHEDQTILWNKRGKEARCKYDSLKNRLTKVRKLAKIRD